MEIILLLFAIPFAWNSLLQGQVLLFASLEIIFFILFFLTSLFIYLHSYSYIKYNISFTKPGICEPWSVLQPYHA